ncbi:MAG: hypothetical protein ACRD3C_22620 [Vicinamibacterales bacterium]
MSATSPFKTFKALTDDEHRALVHEANLERLARVAKEIETRRDFEDMVLLSEHPEAFRALVEPMLRPDLPCCGAEWNEAHQARCPRPLTDEQRRYLAAADAMNDARVPTEDRMTWPPLNGEDALD